MLTECRLTLTEDVYRCGLVGSEDCEECRLSYKIGLTTMQAVEVSIMVAHIAGEALCRCGHIEDDHSSVRNNRCDLSFACGCTGFGV